MKKIELPPDNAMAKLKPGPGVETVQNDCMICHSTDYIVRQPDGNAKHWEPEVRKMITVYGAPIPEADIQTIVNYLSAEYGAQIPPSSTPASSERPVQEQRRQHTPSASHP